MALPTTPSASGALGGPRLNQDIVALYFFFFSVNDTPVSAQVCLIKLSSSIGVVDPCH